ncbi:MAG: efflux RND transporter periplasmic adaptor subunit [Eudoraea sp.]|nr:efflux RND transporter periplasmic adaptor subunit [Eudoraea sp.]
MKRPLKTSLFFFLSLILLFSCKENEKGETATQATEDSEELVVVVTKTQFEGNAMELGTPSDRPLPTVISVAGMIDVPPQNIASISAIKGGYIRDIPLLVGDAVRKGQALVTLENPEFVALQQEYLETTEQLNYLKSEYERQQVLLDENVTSRKNFLKAESEYKSAIARSEGLRKQLLLVSISPKQVEAGNISSSAKLYAPIGGSVSQIHVTKGMYVSPTTEILEIVNTDHIHLELNVFEKDINKLQKGQHIHFKVPEVSSESFEAEISVIGTTLEENRTIKVHADLTGNDDVLFLRGMFVDAQIEIESGVKEQEQQLTLPESAVVEQEGRFYILILETENDDGYSLRKVEVQAGNASGGLIEISSEELNPSDQILIKGAFEVMPM